MLTDNYSDEIQEENFEQDVLADVTAVVDWLEENKPTNESELNELIELIVNWKVDSDAYGDRYGIKRWNDVMFAFGGGPILVLQRDEMHEYMLDLLDGLREEVAVECHAVGVAA